MWTRVASSMLCVPALLLAGARYATGQSARVTSSQSLPGRVVDVKGGGIQFPGTGHHSRRGGSAEGALEWIRT